MMQDYDFLESLLGESTNTSSESVGIKEQPSDWVLQNIKQYARSVQSIKVDEHCIKICLN